MEDFDAIEVFSNLFYIFICHNNAIIRECLLVESCMTIQDSSPAGI